MIGVRTMLVVDDHESTREGVQVGLEMLGYKVITASNGREAVLKFKEHSPDLVVMDKNMPVMGGLAATREIVSSSLLSRVVGFSANTSEAEFRDAGAIGVVDKMQGSDGIDEFAKKICEPTYVGGFGEGNLFVTAFTGGCVL